MQESLGQHTKLRDRIMRKTLLLISFFTLFSNHLFGQNDRYSFIDSLNNLITTSPLGSEEQEKHVLALKSLLKKTATDKSVSDEEKKPIWTTLNQLINKIEFYEILRPQVKVDTIDIKVAQLESKLDSLENSITNIVNELKVIIENPEENNKTKEAALLALLKIQRQDIIEYALKNEKDFQFGEIDWDEYPMDESNRTAMKGIYKYKTENNWMLFPFIFKDFATYGVFEIGIFKWFYKYKSPWLLTEFMNENASTESKSVIERLHSNFNRLKPKE